MPTFNGINLKHSPLPISNDQIEAIANAPTKENEDIAIAEKLIQHLNLIKEYKDRIEAINYLSANAAKLAGNPVYSTSNDKLISAIADMGGTGNRIDFLLFQQVVDIVIDGYKNMALNSLAGVSND